VAAADKFDELDEETASPLSWLAQLDTVIAYKSIRSFTSRCLVLNQSCFTKLAFS